MDQEIAISDENLTEQSENEGNIIHVIIIDESQELSEEHTADEPRKNQLDIKIEKNSNEASYQGNQQEKTSSVESKKDKRFKCQECGTLFTRRNDMKKHMNNLHLGIKPHKCEECKKSFAHKGDLNRHKNEVHGGIKSIECELCGKSFARKNQFTKHQKEHDKESEKFGFQNLRSMVTPQHSNTK